MTELLWVAGGGAVGAVLRWSCVSAAARYLPGIPAGTVAVNLLGSFVIGLVLPWLFSRNADAEPLRLFFVVGLLGSFTTFSTFSFETLRLAQDGQAALALVNVIVNVVGCLLACALGWFLIHRFVGAAS